MKSKMKESEKAEITFPRLMKSNIDMVVLFISENEGTVVHLERMGHSYIVGEFRTDWIQDSFIEYSGIIELSN